MRKYLVERSVGKVTDNVLSPKVYQLMLRRLDASKDKYVYLYHERNGKYVVVYWVGVDENLPAIRVRLKSGKEIDAPILPAYRRQNAKDLRGGEAQYFSIALDDEATAKGVLSVTLIKEQTKDERNASGRLDPGNEPDAKPPSDAWKEILNAATSGDARVSASRCSVLLR